MIWKRLSMVIYGCLAQSSNLIINIFGVDDLIGEHDVDEYNFDEENGEQKAPAKQVVKHQKSENQSFKKGKFEKPEKKGKYDPNFKPKKMLTKDELKKAKLERKKRKPNADILAKVFSTLFPLEINSHISESGKGDLGTSAS